MYRFEAVTVEGLVQQLAVQYLPHGYWFYVPGSVPSGKDPAAVDEKLIARYGIDVSKWSRHRQRRRGEAAIQYLRFGRFFLLVATHGQHPLFQLEQRVIRDVRREPILFSGYSISFRNGRSSVRIAAAEYAAIESRLTAIARHCTDNELEHTFRLLPFEPYAPIRMQMHALVRTVNVVRQQARLPLISAQCVRTRRRVVHPFGVDDGSVGCAA